jgi:hypothetical protein
VGNPRRARRFGSSEDASFACKYQANDSVLVAQPVDRGAVPSEKLKFDSKSTDGIDKHAFRGLHSLGSGTSAQVKTGHVDSFKLTSDEAAQRYLRNQLKAGGTIWIVVFPDDEEVATTYFGTGSEPEANRPRLEIEIKDAK